MEKLKEIVDFIEGKRGERIPESHVKDWDENGLLPPFETIIGAETGWYPDGTKEQALIVYDKLKEDKSFERILFELWVENRKVDFNRVKRLINPPFVHL